jgi:CheY-like chemotaxis protein
MIPNAERLRIIIVSEDWFARSLLESTLRESGMFSRIIAVDDGYTAIAEAWQGVEDGSVPDIILADGALTVMSPAELIRSLRENPETERIFFAVLTEFATEPEQEAPEVEGADFSSPCSAGCTDLAEIVAELACRAVNTVRSSSTTPPRDTWHIE